MIVKVIILVVLDKDFAGVKKIIANCLCCRPESANAPPKIMTACKVLQDRIILASDFRLWVIEARCDARRMSNKLV